MWKPLALTVLGLGLALLGERFVTFRSRLNASRKLDPVGLPGCRLIPGIETGAEDIEILPNGLAFLSTGIRYPGIKSFAPDSPGAILFLDLNQEDPQPRTLDIRGALDKDSFNPHGISAFVDSAGTVNLYVVNHPHLNTMLELFRFEADAQILTHIKTIQHPLLYSVNDLVALGPDRFYATNDHYFTQPLLAQLELFLGLSWTNVVFSSPEGIKMVAQGFTLANGIAISPDHKFLYVADFGGQNIHVLERHGDWNLTLHKVLELGTLVDNLFVDPSTGDVWAGCHLSVMKLFNYDPEDPPGSEVLRIQDILSAKPTVTTVFADNGSLLQGSSVAAVFGRKLLIGTVFQRALACHL
ncbi:serum paraoxonase/arylesterase 2-like isoform X1 [Tachyglossus aculeatus]|uniref:serum paraoxonase/arylesterase 2-like isoform X1 n=1 Tax=Tachyglossus aculeatus TaxID=9261 RepID=UPI0018F4ECDF|nr:serum paraoxonase/arylesterase 2-like isoform X1 [Tachyglossus aculeatus]